MGSSQHIASPTVPFTYLMMITVRLRTRKTFCMTSMSGSPLMAMLTKITPTRPISANHPLSSASHTNRIGGGMKRLITLSTKSCFVISCYGSRGRTAGRNWQVRSAEWDVGSATLSRGYSTSRGNVFRDTGWETPDCHLKNINISEVAVAYCTHHARCCPRGSQRRFASMVRRIWYSGPQSVSVIL